MSESLPLHGVRVLDLSDEATVLASRFLADLGADVVRAEAMTGGPVTSAWAPLLGEHDEEVLRGLLGLQEEEFQDLLIDGTVY